ncbi:MAG: RecX family transcriptional regulator [Bacteroidetes bacterium]|nr:RecX family transcriptional regulator [Bacteroidota bacterium]MBU1719397.1 RecX family transcriptional regulator [Bacteroidota bacterium]
MQKKIITPLVALERVRKYCAYQERCHADVRQKLRELDVDSEHTEAIIAQVIDEGFLNEERFAIAYSRGKFRIKHWGKLKIRQALKMRQISEYCIKKALVEIDMEEYFMVLENLAEKKWADEKGQHQAIRKNKVFRYLAGKGFESNLIQEVLEEVIKK